TAHFEARRDWVSFSEALDAYTVIGYNAVPRDRRAYEDILTAIRRRLAAPELSLRERGDALGMFAVTCVMMSDLDRCVDEARRQIDRLRPGEPVIHLQGLVSQACMVAYMSGRWHELDDLLHTLATIWEQLQYDVSAGHGVADGYIAALHVALAREDRASADAAYSLLTRILATSTESGRAVLAAVRDGNPTRLLHDLQVHTTGPMLLATDEEGGAVLTLMFCNEYGVVAPEGMIDRVGGSAWHAAMYKDYLAVAAALAAGDDARLSAAVDAAEADSLVVHAARLRIVLAQRTGDRTQLDRARPVLVGLGD